LDESAGLGCEGAALVAVVGGAFGECALVVVADLCEDNRIEAVDTYGAAWLAAWLTSSRVSAMAWAHSCPAGSASDRARRSRSR
jgi:hypothetical protein